MLGADTGIVQPRRHAVRLDGLAVGVLQDVREGTVEDARDARREACGVLAARDALATRLEADEAHRFVVDEAVEDADGVGPAPDAGEHGVGKASDEVEHLLARLDPDDPVEVADHLGERVRPGHGAEDVLGRRDVGHPVRGTPR